MKTLIFYLGFLLIPATLFAGKNLLINGATSHTVTTLPATVILTCDLAKSGNQIELEIFLDVNHSRQLESDDILIDYSIITDGIGWIRDPENPAADITGDETSVDGKIKSTFIFDENARFYRGGTFIIRITDQDGSTATATLTFDIQPQPPLITGKVLDFQTGAPVPDAVVFATLKNNDYEFGFGVSEANGDYFINVMPGEWQVVTTDFMHNQYMPSDTLTVTVSESETAYLNIQLNSYNSFVVGTTKTIDGSPVAGVQITARTMNKTNFSFTASNESGEYKLGVVPGKIIVSPSMFSYSFMPTSNWPEGYFAEPDVDTVQVAAGEKKNADFTFKPYTTFIEGICYAENAPLAGVEISAFTIDVRTGLFHGSSTYSDENGHYKLGVLPGRIAMLGGDKDGYDLVTPMFGYTGLTIEEGKTINGKNFTFAPNNQSISVSGQVLFDDGTVGTSIYVVAVHNDGDDRRDYRILHTDATGVFRAEGLEEGNWRIGVYKDGYNSEPPIFYKELVPGTQIKNANFTLKEQHSSTLLSETDGLPSEFSLTQNYPNPFQPELNSSSTQITFNLPKPSTIEMNLFNVNGQLIKRLQAGYLNQGEHRIEWDGRNEAGLLVPSGIYFYQITTGAKCLTRRLLILR